MLADVAAQMLARIGEQSKFIGEQGQQLDERNKQIASQAQAIKFKDVKIERITFELSRLKAYRFGAKTERMDAEQRQMFEEALAEDQASLEAQLLALQGERGQTPAPPPEEKTKNKPRRQALPEHLRRVEYRHEPENTTCPSAECGQAMTRIGEDITEKLDIVPAEFFVHRHIRGFSGGGAPAPGVGLQVLPGPGAAAGSAADHRQGHAGPGIDRTRLGQPLR